MELNPIKPRLKKKYKTKKEKGKEAKEAKFQKLSAIKKDIKRQKGSLSEENNLREIV